MNPAIKARYFYGYIDAQELCYDGVNSERMQIFLLRLLCRWCILVALHSLLFRKTCRMKRTFISPVLGGALFVLFAAGLFTARAEHQSAQLLIKSTRGQASYCADGIHWLPLGPDVVLSKGAVLRTGASSTADIVLKSSGTALRMIPNTLLEVTRLEKEAAGEEVITWTVLDLRAGAVIASQHKLDRLSSFQINTLAGPVAIGGTEYLVQADGTVRCFAGQIWLGGNFAGNNGNFDVPAGFSFDPITKAIVPIAPGLLSVIAVDLDAVRKNARTVKQESGPAVVNRTHDHKTSPGNGHHHGDDNGGGDDNGQGGDNDGGNENGGPGGNGGGNGGHGGNGGGGHGDGGGD